MITQLYVIRDCLAEESSTPMPASNDKIAMAMFIRSMRQHPEDPSTFKLLHIGSYDTLTSIITPLTEVRELDVAMPAVSGLVHDLMGMGGKD